MTNAEFTLQALRSVGSPENAPSSTGCYGNELVSAGPYADANPFRFSTKWYDDETGLYMYPARPYGPRLGRWLNRDPIEEEGGLNLYQFTYNDPIDYVDPLGNEPIWSCWTNAFDGKGGLDAKYDEWEFHIGGNVWARGKSKGFFGFGKRLKSMWIFLETTVNFKILSIKVFKVKLIGKGPGGAYTSANFTIPTYKPKWRIPTVAEIYTSTLNYGTNKPVKPNVGVLCKTFERCIRKCVTCDADDQGEHKNAIIKGVGREVVGVLARNPLSPWLFCDATAIRNANRESMVTANGKFIFTNPPLCQQEDAPNCCKLGGCQ